MNNQRTTPEKPRCLQSALNDLLYDGSASTCTIGEPKVLTMEKLQEAISKIPPCPFAQRMKKENCDPKDGWVLMLPMQDLEPEDIDRLPEYVRMSRIIDEPVMIREPKSLFSFGLSI